ncbi:hypothetical protein ACLMJK_001556 [Lecanora helva]
MDPLSIAASFVGITTAAVQVSHVLKRFISSAKDAPSSARAVRMELKGINACLRQLEGFLMGKEEASRSRRSLIMIEQIVVVFTDCVSTFSELEQTLETLQEGEHMGLIDRMKWSLKETTISKILARLHSCKTSLDIMLTILTCTSLDRAEASTSMLAIQVQDVLRSHVNMAHRLKNLERLHPALTTPLSVSQDDFANSESSKSRAPNRMTYPRSTFEEELEISTVYKRAAVKQLRFSKSSSSTNGLSYLSGLSLSDVSNVSAIALPVFSTELWNHHRYCNTAGSDTTKCSSLEAWYNPPAKKSAFIRTAYFNGQYTNQYAQSRFTGHLIYRRFTITAPDSPPVFTEGVVMPHSAKALEKIGEESSEKDETFELEDTAVDIQEASSTNMPLRAALDMGSCNMASNESTKRKRKPSSYSTPEVSQDQIPQDWPQPPKKSLPPVPPTAYKGSEVRLARRRKTPSPSCSLLCEEEEAIFPTRKWSKPLSNMGDALNWKLSVLNKFNAIQY